MGDWKGIRLTQGKPLELYNLRDNPEEARNVAAGHADVVARIERFMAAAHTPNPYWPDRRKNQPAANG
jgi:hypothetical protein